MDEDPEVLAAIEASKQDYLEEDLEDPLIKAALAESMKDAEVENIKTIEPSRDEKDSENNVDKTDTEEKNTAGDKDISQEECDNKFDESVSEAVSVSGGKRTPEPSSPSTSLNRGDGGGDGEEDGRGKGGGEGEGEGGGESEGGDGGEGGGEGKTNGHKSDGEPEGCRANDNENNETEADSQGGGEITLEGVPEIQENPFTSEETPTSEQTPSTTEDCDPLEDSGGNNLGEMSELIEQVDPGRSRHTSAGSSKSSLSGSGTKRKRSTSCSSSDWESNKKKELRPRTKSRTEVTFNCSVCTFNSEVLGEVNIHQHRAHTAQQKPSYLDIAELVVAQLDDKAGSKKDAILEEMQKNYSEFLESDLKQSAQILSRALTGGVQRGRLRLGGKGNAAYYIAGREKRKIVYDRWKINKRSVEYKDVKSIAEGSKEFKDIQATLNKLNIMVTNSSGVPAKKEESDDEICVVEEKITDKARRRAEHRKKLIAQKKRQLAMQREAARAGPKTVIKVNSAQGKNLIRKIVATGSVPKQAMKSPVKKSSRLDDDDDDVNLTCPVCLSSFWYPNQNHEHMKTVHNIENPGKYIKEKSSRKR